MKFEEFNLDEKLLQGLTEAGYIECMPVQEQTLKHTLSSTDVAVQSQTGTGKTAAFLISVLQLFKNGTSGDKKTLIVVPTRELAVQIEEEAKLLAKHLDISIASIFGGTGYKKQEDLIAKGVDIIIGTPGRLIDFGKSGKIKFNEIGTLIIDEADRMFDMGFIPDLRWMIRKMPPRENRMTMLFSATLNSRVRELAWEYMHDPAEVEIAPDSITVDEINQVLYHVAREEKLKLLLGILKKENPSTAVVFINTKQKAVELSKRLNHNGYRSSYLMGDMPQKKRLSTIDRVKSGDIKLLVATDVAARGLHINDLEMVFNYDLPEDCENYVHRIGRTARAGKTGKAVSLACEKYVLGLPAIEEYIKMKIPVAWAEEELFVEDTSEGIRMQYDRYSTSSHDNRNSRGRYSHDRGASSSRDSRSRSSRDNSGSCNHDRSGSSSHDNRGRSSRDNSGSYNRDRNGSSSHDNRDRFERDRSSNSNLDRSSNSNLDRNSSYNRDNSSRRNDSSSESGRNRPESERRTRENTVRKPDSPRPENKQAVRGSRKYTQDTHRNKESINRDAPKSGESMNKKSANKTYSNTKKTSRSYEDRIKYYNEKYGEDYKMKSDESGTAKSGKNSFIKRIKKIFKK
jgi:ATP-dependent RNA helicase RhlB